MTGRIGQRLDRLETRAGSTDVFERPDPLPDRVIEMLAACCLQTPDEVRAQSPEPVSRRSRMEWAEHGMPEQLRKRLAEVTGR